MLAGELLPALHREARGFLAAFDLMSNVLIAEMAHEVHRRTRHARSNASTRALAPVPRRRSPTTGPTAALFLVEAYAAGPEAIERRHAVNSESSPSWSTCSARESAGRFACQSIVAAVSALVIEPLINDDPDVIVDIGPTVSDHLHRLHAVGLLR